MFGTQNHAQVTAFKDSQNHRPNLQLHTDHFFCSWLACKLQGFSPTKMFERIVKMSWEQFGTKAKNRTDCTQILVSPFGQNYFSNLSDAHMLHMSNGKLEIELKVGVNLPPETCCHKLKCASHTPTF